MQRNTIDDHINSLVKLFSVLERYNVKLDPKKTEFARTEISWCGHLLSNGTINPDPNKLDAFKNLPIPESNDQNATVWKSFFGVGSSLRKFIVNYATLEQQIRECLCQSESNEISTSERNQNILKIKNKILQNLEKNYLTIPPENTPIIIETDSSFYATGHIIYCQPTPKEKKIYWIGSKGLSKNQQRVFNTFEKELLAIVDCITSNKQILSRASVIHIYTDNLTNSLQLNNTCKINPISTRSLRLLLQIQTMPFSEKITFHHIDGVLNAIAHKLSRLRTEYLQPAVTTTQVNILTRQQSAKAEIQALHASTHSGPNKLYQTCKAYGILDNSQDNLRSLCQEVCDACQYCFNEHKVLSASVQNQLELPPREFYEMSADHVHLPTRCKISQAKYISTLVCSFSRFLLAFPVKDKSMATSAEKLETVLQIFPQIKVIRVDNDFDSDLTHNLPVTIKLSAVHNSQTQLCEKTHRTLWEKLKTIQKIEGVDDQYLDQILIQAVNCYNRQCHSATGVPPDAFLRRKFDPNDKENIFTCPAFIRKLRVKVKEMNLASKSLKYKNELQIPMLPVGSEILIRYHPKMTPVSAIIEEDFGLTLLVRKLNTTPMERYKRIRSSKKICFSEKEYQK